MARLGRIRAEIVDEECFRVALIGGPGVGKSSLAHRFVNDVFEEELDPTISDTYSRRIVVEEKGSRLELLDLFSMGGEYQKVEEWASNEVDGFVVMSEYPQDEQQYPMEQVGRMISNYSHHQLNLRAQLLPKVFVFTKMDLLEETPPKGQEITIQGYDPCKHPIYFVSAKTGEGVEKVFEDLALQYRTLAKTNKKKSVASSTPKIVYFVVNDFENSLEKGLLGLFGIPLSQSREMDI